MRSADERFLLTVVGVLQILAGDEFADQHDLFDEQGYVAHWIRA